MFDHLYLIINFFNEQLETNFTLFFLLYLFLLIIFFSLSLPGGPVLIISSGFFFGFYIGFLINIIAILIGSFVFIYILKNLFKNLFNLFYLKFSKRLNNLIKYSTYEYLILIRLIGGPLFIQNLFFSFTDISKFKFFISSFFGFSPTIFLFTYFGSKIYEIYELKNFKSSDIISTEFIFFTIVLIILIFIRIIYKIKKR